MAIETAKDSEYTPKKVIVDTFTSIEDKDPLDNTGSPERINQQRVLPSAIQTRLIGDLFSNNPSSDALGSGIRLSQTIPNAASVSFGFILTDNQNRELFAIPDLAPFVGETVSPDTAWPNANYGMGNMPWTWYYDWGITNNRNIAVRAVMRNNTGADQKVTFVCRFRIIANPGQSAAN